ncbi:MAG: signal transduction histidine kinase, partial [Planctomycetaceae bacterium]
MTFKGRNVVFRSTVAATLSIGVAMLAVLAIGLWGGWRDLSDVRSAFLRAEIGRLRSHGIRTVARLESELESADSEAGLTSLQDADWLRDTVWLQRFWNRVIPQERQRLYAAIVSASGDVVMHSDEQLIGLQLEDAWQSDSVPEASESDDVFLTRSWALSGNRPAFDIVIPIELNGRVVGFYHSGFDQSWFDGQVAARQTLVRQRWIFIVGSVFVVVLLAAVSLQRINRHYAALQQAISMARVKQLSDLGRLVGALAHEIRNPLNAIRLNLHALRNVLLGKGTLSEDEIQLAVEESNREIDRVSGLMKTLLGYARPDQAVAETVELNSELESISGFLMQVIERDCIEFSVDTPQEAVHVVIDPDRLRQTLLNLLNNAREAVGTSGRVSLTLRADETQAEIIVADDGPGIPQ